MDYQVRNIPLLKKILWADCFLGGITALAFLFSSEMLADFLGLRANLVVTIGVITLAYAALALILALQSSPSAQLLRILVYANWVWTVISAVLLTIHIPKTTLFGAAFLILQVIVVGLLAYLEGRHVTLIE